MSDGSPVSYNDMFISHGVAQNVIFPWSMSLDIDMSVRLWRPHIDGSPTVKSGESYYSHGVAYITFNMSRSSSMSSSNYLYFTLYDGSPTGFWNFGALDYYGVA